MQKRGDGYVRAIAGDLNQDGRLDLVVLNSSTVKGGVKIDECGGEKPDQFMMLEYWIQGFAGAAGTEACDPP
jgi:hypothetical protein